MKVWTVILAVSHLAALLNLGNGVREDAGVFVIKNYTKFERRVLPELTFMVCTNFYVKHPWYRFNEYEQILLDFERGNNSRNATLSLGTPTLTVNINYQNVIYNNRYCKLTPRAYRNTELRNGIAENTVFPGYNEYFAVKVNDTGRATILKGWNYLTNLIKYRFPNIVEDNYVHMVIEKTAAGVIYVGALQTVA